MADLNTPDRAPDSGRIGMPSVQPGMNKRAPGLEGADDKDRRALGADKKGEDDEKILGRIRKRMDRCIGAEADNRKSAVAALKFKAGDQWPSDVASQRNTDRRPCLTVNKLPIFIRQITNDQRQNRPAINVSPVGDRGDKEVAKMYRGMIRAIERDSNADVAYDTAFENAVSNGFGYCRILTEWEDGASFRQVIRVRRVRNPFTVYLDPDHQEPDGSDCRYGFVTEMVPKDEFEDLYPDATPVSFTQAGQGEKLKNWTDKDGIRVAEYYELKTDMADLIELDTGHVGWKDDLSDEVKKKLADGRIMARRERKAERHKVMWYKVTAIEILDEKEWPGHSVPLYPVIGNEIDIEGKVKLTGLIDAAMDPQRMYNYWRTKETEAIALAPNSPWLVEEGQIEGHEQEWRNANTKPMPYLSYKGTSVSGHPAPPPQRQPFAQVPAGIEAAIQGAAQDMMATTGIRFDPASQSASEADHRESGRMLREVRRSTDIGAYHYVDNLARMLRRLGHDMVDLIPKVYDETQVLTILREDDAEEQVKLDPHAGQAFTEESQGPGKPKIKVFNPKAGKYGVTVTIGPSYATKRIEAGESMMEFAKAMPAVAGLIADLIAKNMDWEGGEEMAARLAKAVPANLLSTDHKDMSPQVQALVQSLQSQLQQLGQQLQAAMAQLNDKSEDRAIARQKIEADFEAKILATLSRAEADGNQLEFDKIKTVIDTVRAESDAQRQPEQQKKAPETENA
jgi:hypothetical protein